MTSVTVQQKCVRLAASFVVLWAGTIALLPVNRTEAAAARQRPNILVIMSDEHNAGVLGCYGNRIAQTPNLDRLAERGITFDAAYTTSPLCVPARLSFTSGKYISRVGAWNNGCWLPSADYPSIARIMTAAGYESLLCGKMHYDKTRRYGFTEIGHTGSNQSFKNGRDSVFKEFKKGRRPADALTPPANVSPRFNNFHPAEHSGVLDRDRKVTESAVDFLSKRKPADKPFFLCVGYLAPHFPLIVPDQYWELYKGKVPMPVIPEGHLESLPLNYQHLRVGFKKIGVPDDAVRKGRELYYGLTTWLDEEIGKVLNALNDSGLTENTVIIYTTDHGENMGEHGLWWKNCMFDHAARIPLIITWPRRFKGAQRRAGVCSMVDLTQTIAELGGTKTPDDWNGDSMLAWMDDPNTKWKDRAVSEYYAHNIASGFVMLRQGRYKYVYHTRPDDKHSPECELYDLQTDPDEFNNLAREPAHAERLQQMHALLLKELGEDPDISEQRCRADCVKGYGRKKSSKR